MFSRTCRISLSKKRFPGRELEILFAGQVFGLEQGVQDMDDIKYQAVRIFLVEFTFLKFEIGQKNGQKHAHSSKLAKMWVHHALRLFSPDIDYIDNIPQKSI